MLAGGDGLNLLRATHEDLELVAFALCFTRGDGRPPVVLDRQAPNDWTWVFRSAVGPSSHVRSDAAFILWVSGDAGRTGINVDLAEVTIQGVRVGRACVR